MKLYLLATLALLTLVTSSAFAEETDEQVCTAIYETLDGDEHWARVECDGPYAGKCLKEVVLQDGSHDWEIVACK